MFAPTKKITSFVPDKADDDIPQSITACPYNDYATLHCGICTYTWYKDTFIAWCFGRYCTHYAVSFLVAGDCNNLKNLVVWRSQGLMAYGGRQCVYRYSCAFRSSTPTSCSERRVSGIIEVCSCSNSTFGERHAALYWKAIMTVSWSHVDTRHTASCRGGHTFAITWQLHARFHGRPMRLKVGENTRRAVDQKDKKSGYQLTQSGSLNAETLQSRWADNNTYFLENWKIKEIKELWNRSIESLHKFAN